MRWMLPDGVEEWLPPESWQPEGLRRQVIDTFAAHGFELVLAPLIEYTDSLLSGIGEDLALRTFAVTDQISGRRLGFRADITPQAARIDAHRYASDAAGVRRLCYLGTVLRTHPDVPGGPRSLRQLWAEIFGHPGLEADVEVISLMCEILTQAGREEFTLDLGHVGILRALLPENLAEVDAARLLPAVQRKAQGEVRQIGEAVGLDAERCARLADLCEWHGPPELLEQKAASADPLLRPALDALLDLSVRLRQRFPGRAQHLDCGELSGFRYETGVTWAAYAPGHGRALARGGRYDGIGRQFGAERAATGFSADLNSLLTAQSAAPAELVWAPSGDEAALLAAIRSARAAGHRVRQCMPGEKMGPGAQLQRTDGEWTITTEHT